MPLTSLIPAIVSSIIESAADEAANAPKPPVPQQGPAIGIARTIPAGKQGVMSHAAIGSVVIDGKTLPMSPGAQIRNEMNIMIVPSMVQKEATVRYVVDSMGYVNRIWILTPAELAASPGTPIQLVVDGQ